MHFIKKVLKQRAELNIQKLADKYDLSTRTIQNWEQGKLPKGRRNKPNTKLNLEDLKQDVIDYPDAYQIERGQRLGVSKSCICYNLKKLSITYKKNTIASESRRRKAIIVSKKDRAT
jgi:transcriptional antiterminator